MELNVACLACLATVRHRIASALNGKVFSLKAELTLSQKDWGAISEGSRQDKLLEKWFVQLEK